MQLVKYLFRPCTWGMGIAGIRPATSYKLAFALLCITFGINLMKIIEKVYIISPKSSSMKNVQTAEIRYRPMAYMSCT